MSYSARVFRVLIASPSDVAEERDIAVKTIQEWNDLNSNERQVVLLPLRWETHSAPEYGKRPQEVINRQIVDHCDLLVGIFWTRVGSPTGLADSGTLEEIERVAKQGKPVMLYFSQAKQDPERIDLEQLRSLREFKQKTFPKALVESYSTQIEFRDKLAKQIEIELRSLLAQASEESSDGLRQRPITDIQFAFADTEKGTHVGSEMTIKSFLLEPTGLDELPDYTDSERSPGTNVVNTLGGVGSIVLSTNNRNYFRELASYYVRSNYFRIVRFWVKNVGGVGARDCYIDIRIASNEAGLTASSVSRARLTPPSKTAPAVFYGYPNEPAENSLEQIGSEWNTHLEIRALQPQREISTPPMFVIGSSRNALITITAKIYADTLPEPIVRDLRIIWELTRETINAKDLLKEELAKD